MIKLYTVQWVLPSLWGTYDYNAYEQLTRPFADSDLFTVKEFRDTEYFAPIEATRDVITDEELLELMTVDATRQALGKTTLVKTIDSFKQVAEPRLADAFNERVEVHMPGNAMLTYNRTLLLEDACTNYLQEQLDDGWRIIAACPQPDQRRPDYILGRYEP